MSENSSKPYSKFHFDLDNSDFYESQKQTLLYFVNKNDDSFSEGLHELGRTALKTHVIDTGDARPVKMSFYKQTPEMRRETKKQTEDMLENDLIKEINSNKYSAFVLVKKANSDKYWFAVDYRKLNKSSKPQSYQIPRLSDIFDAIGEANSQYFTSLDLGKAFW